MGESTLAKWLSKATPEEKKKLAERALTTPGYLRQLAHGHRTASADTAGFITKAAASLHREGLPTINRGNICPTCRNCPHYKKGVSSDV